MKPCSTLNLTRLIPISPRVPSLSHSNIGFLNYPSHFAGTSCLKMRASKNLIEDEPVLDWGLRSDSFPGRRNGDSMGKRRRDGDSEYNASSTRGRGGYSNRGRENRDSFDSYSGASGERGRHGGEFERRGYNDSRGYGRESNSNEYEMTSRGRGRGGYSSRGRENRGSFESRGNSNEYGVTSRGRGGYSSRGRGGLPNRGRGGLMSRGRGNRGSDDYGRGGYSNSGRGGRGGRDSFESRGRGQFGGEMEGRNEGYMRKEYSSRGGRNSVMGRSRDDRGSRQDQGGPRDRGMKAASVGYERAGLLLSDNEDTDEDEDEEVIKLRDNIQELIIGKNSEATEDEEDDNSLFETAGSFSGLGIRANPANSTINSDEGNDSYLSETRFDQCSISSSSLRAINDAGYEKMTIVQEATLPLILKGKDVLAKARTGTGKTVAFLLPSIEVISETPTDRDQKRPPILVLVICPTRELANQAAAEANKLIKYHSSIGVQVVIGGTRLALEQKRMQANPCQILVATPGRLKDHIENTMGFATRLMGVKVLVLDEADHLLDMGFRRDIERIIAAVPKQRQTLLFSATVPQEVRQICHIALKRDHEYVNTVEEGSEETHAKVVQTHLVAPLEKHFPLLYVLLKEHIADDPDYKVLVFCTTAMVTRLVADLLGILNLNVREIHSRKQQSYRTRVSDEFRRSKGLILVTSDVSARGVDYPDVTLVIQMGLPADKEQYIHRLGRTGRKGKEGLGVLLLAPWEKFFLSNLSDLPLSEASPPSIDPDTVEKVERAFSRVEMKNKEAAYQAWLGYYNSNKTVGKDKQRLVELANNFSRCLGLDIPPAISKQVLGKMGLRNVPGLRSK
ncbi:hypothetical protein DCAR_0206034 [Daucus carota subsp. sativus]|uniref:ATP-dependent RNA helicase n=1 Tax=Daucus carota subsp. sativus TaxID=79200 RepID=A0AAF0WDI8_DAUCS|nr:PREDICTED: DEAD-box ATP-dependent RNA helicase 31-like [Daucus carota subsp. sativus]WOG86816.1 hypothetical protein DCAR_0206034 [Daucus carota subsp. sativus]